MWAQQLLDAPKRVERVHLQQSPAAEGVPTAEVSQVDKPRDCDSCNPLLCSAVSSDEMFAVMPAKLPRLGLQPCLPTLTPNSDLSVSLHSTLRLSLGSSRLFSCRVQCEEAWFPAECGRACALPC